MKPPLDVHATSTGFFPSLLFPSFPFFPFIPFMMVSLIIITSSLDVGPFVISFTGRRKITSVHAQCDIHTFTVQHGVRSTYSTSLEYRLQITDYSLQEMLV